MKKLFIVLLAMFTLFSLTACKDKNTKEEVNNYNETTQKENVEVNTNEEEKTEANNAVEENNQTENQQEENNNNEYIVVDDEIIEIDDEDNAPIEEEIVKVEKVINCDGCVFSYFSEVKKIGSTLSTEEYTTDVTKLKTPGGKQRHNFFGFVLSGNTISKAYSCILKNNKIYCIQGSTNGAYFSNNIGVLNQIFTSSQCKYLSDGNNYWCTDGSYNGNTKKSGYTALHYDTSCTIYGSDARTGELICH